MILPPFKRILTMFLGSHTPFTYKISFTSLQTEAILSHPGSSSVQLLPSQ